MKGTLKRVVILALIAVMVLLTGCSTGNLASPAPSASEAPSASQTSGAPSSSPSANIVSSKDTLVIANTYGEPGKLHPYNEITAGAGAVFSSLFEQLLAIDDNGKFVPALAEKWEVSDTEIVFYIRQGVKFQNGDNLTADDVVFSLQELMLRSTGGYVSNYTNVDAANITAVDQFTVKVPLKKVDSTVLPNLAINGIILSKNAYQTLGDKFQYQPVGTGPFGFKEWVVGDHITLTRFDGYWGGSAKIQTVTFRTIADASQAQTELETGGVDLILSPQGRSVVKALNKEIANVQALTTQTCILRTNNLSFNWLSQYMNNHLVREAIAYTVDREAWTKICSPGVGAPAYTCIAAGIWGSDKSVTKDNYPYKHDINKAKDLMTQAGYPNGFSCMLLTDGRDYHQSLAQLVQGALKEIGITVEIQTLQLPQQIQQMQTGQGYDLFLMDDLGNAVDPLSAIFRGSYPPFATVSGNSYRYYTVKDEHGQQYTDLMDQIKATTDDAKRLDLCKQLQQLQMQDIVWLPINTIQSYALCNANLANVAFKSGIAYVSNMTYFK